MKKTISILFLSFLLGMIYVLAGMFPQPVVGQISVADYPYPEGLVVEQRNLRTGLVYSTSVDESGFYLLDWANLPYHDGDSVEISIKICKDNPICRKLVILQDGTPARVDFAVNAAQQQVIDQIKEVVKYYYVCSDLSVREAPELCPLPPQTEPQVKEIITQRFVYLCQDGSLAKGEEACKDPFKVLFLSVSGLIGLVAIGLLALFAKNRRKYRWVPGTVKQLQNGLEQVKALKDAGKNEAATKKLKTLEKRTGTLLKRHVEGK